MFWDFKDISLDAIALIDSANSKIIRYGELIRKSINLEKILLGARKQLIFLFADNSYQSIVAYIAILRSGNTCCLIDKNINHELKAELVNNYNPEIIISNDSEMFSNYNQTNIEDSLHLYRYSGKLSNHPNIFPNLALLLSTSGSTGNPKFVRLSYTNIQSNAESIAEYLDITFTERPITSLPFSYSFGMSIINSHLLKGASIVLTNKSFVLRDFWSLFNKYNCTSFSGVPYSYLLLKKINFANLNLPTLRTMTQAGGRLSEKLQREYYTLALQKGFKFFVMYGQTEASPRIAYIPMNILSQKFGAIGYPIPNGKIFIISEGRNVTDSGEEGEIVYEGANVMLGYAICRKDLAKNDENMGVLFTGDLGRCDEDGCFYVTGRLKRFIKLHGTRFNLDDLEKMVENRFGFPNMCCGEDDNLFVIIKTSDVSVLEKIKNGISEYYKINKSFINVNQSSSLPYSNSGKPDYSKVIKSVKKQLQITT